MEEVKQENWNEEVGFGEVLEINCGSASGAMRRNAREGERGPVTWDRS